MIFVEIARDEKGRIEFFKCEGHAGFKKHPDEKDMVCAAVSAIVYGALGYMDEYYKLRDFTEKDGFIEWIRPVGIGENIINSISPVLDAMEVGLKQIEMQYGKNIKVTDKANR